MTQEILRKIYCMSYDTFLSLIEMNDSSYTEDKWSEFKSNMAVFLMDLDERRFAKFTAWANS